MRRLKPGRSDQLQRRTPELEGRPPGPGDLLTCVFLLAVVTGGGYAELSLVPPSTQWKSALEAFVFCLARCCQHTCGGLGPVPTVHSSAFFGDVDGHHEVFLGSVSLWRQPRDRNGFWPSLDGLADFRAQLGRALTVNLQVQFRQAWNPVLKTVVCLDRLHPFGSSTWRWCARVDFKYNWMPVSSSS